VAARRQCIAELAGNRREMRSAGVAHVTGTELRRRITGPWASAPGRRRLVVVPGPMSLPLSDWALDAQLACPSTAAQETTEKMPKRRIRAAHTHVAPRRERSARSQCLCVVLARGSRSQLSFVVLVCTFVRSLGSQSSFAVLGRSLRLQPWVAVLVR
jgi:hypothetical protein